MQSPVHLVCASMSMEAYVVDETEQMIMREIIRLHMTHGKDDDRITNELGNVLQCLIIDTLQITRMQESEGSRTDQHVIFWSAYFTADCKTENLTSKPELGELRRRGSERHYVGLGHQHSVQSLLHSHGFPEAHVLPHFSFQHDGGELAAARAASTSGALNEKTNITAISAKQHADREAIVDNVEGDISKG